MSRSGVFLAAVLLVASASPVLAAVGQQGGQRDLDGRGYSAPGTYELIPLPDSKVPAAWVLNTETGQAWLCGPGSENDEARVTCLQANMHPGNEKQ